MSFNGEQWTIGKFRFNESVRMWKWKRKENTPAKPLCVTTVHDVFMMIFVYFVVVIVVAPKKTNVKIVWFDRWWYEWCAKVILHTCIQNSHRFIFDNLRLYAQCTVFCSSSFFFSPILFSYFLFFFFNSKPNKLVGYRYNNTNEEKRKNFACAKRDVKTRRSETNFYL